MLQACDVAMNNLSQFQSYRPIHSMRVLTGLMAEKIWRQPLAVICAGCLLLRYLEKLCKTERNYSESLQCRDFG